MPQVQVSERQTIFVATPPIDMNGPERTYPVFCALDGDYMFVQAYLHWVKTPGAGNTGQPSIMLGTNGSPNKFGAFNIRSTLSVVGLEIKAVKDKINQGEVLYVTKPSTAVTEDYGIAVFFFLLRRAA